MSETSPSAVPPAPIVDPSAIKEIAPGVFVICDRRVPLVPNIGIILGSNAALVVDTGMGPANGRKVLDAARRIAGQRPLVLTLTHFHPEHGFGAQVFKGAAKIRYNRSQRDELQAKGEAYLGMFRTFGPDVAQALEGTELVQPDEVYDGASTSIDLGGRTVELRTWGLAHTAGDQIVWLPQERILFTGDLAEERIFPIFPWFPPDDAEHRRRALGANPLRAHRLETRDRRSRPRRHRRRGDSRRGARLHGRPRQARGRGAQGRQGRRRDRGRRWRRRSAPSIPTGRRRNGSISPSDTIRR